MFHQSAKPDPDGPLPRLRLGHAQPRLVHPEQRPALVKREALEAARRHGAIMRSGEQANGKPMQGRIAPVVEAGPEVEV